MVEGLAGDTDTNSREKNSTLPHHFQR